MKPKKHSDKKEKQPALMSGYAIIGLITGLFSLLLGWIPLIGWPFIILAIVLSIIGLVKIRRHEHRGKGLAITGLVMGIIGLVLAVLVMVVIIMSDAKTCTTEDCFIDKAYECGHASFRPQFGETGVIQYYTQDCVFTKTMIEVGEDEPQVLRDLLNNKSLYCSYAEEEFDEEWMTSAALGYEDCEGELKDIMMELLLIS